MLCLFIIVELFVLRRAIEDQSSTGAVEIVGRFDDCVENGLDESALVVAEGEQAGQQKQLHCRRCRAGGVGARHSDGEQQWRWHEFGGVVDRCAGRRESRQATAAVEASVSHTCDAVDKRMSFTYFVFSSGSDPLEGYVEPSDEEILSKLSVLLGPVSSSGATTVSERRTNRFVVVCSSRVFIASTTVLRSR